MSSLYYKQTIKYSFCPLPGKTFPELDIGLIYDYSGILIPNIVYISGIYCAREEETDIAKFNEECKKWEWAYNIPETHNSDEIYRRLDDAFDYNGLSDCILEYLNTHGTPFDNIITQKKDEKNIN